MKSIKTDYCGTLIELVQADVKEIKADARVVALDRDQPDGGLGKAFSWMAKGEAVVIKDKSGHEWYCSAGSIIPYPTRALFGSQIYYYTVAPVWKGGHDNEAFSLSSCYVSALDAAEKIGHASLAFPSLGTGSEGYPVHRAAPVALAAIGSWLRKPHTLRSIRLALADDAVFEVYRDTLKWFLTKNSEAVNLNRYRAVFQGTTASNVFGLDNTDFNPSSFTPDLVKALGCPCLEFHQPDSMPSIIKAYQAYQAIGKEEGFLPLLTESDLGLDCHVKQTNWPEEERKTAEETAQAAANQDIPAWVKNEFSKYSDGILAEYERDEGLISPPKGSDDFTFWLHAPEPNMPRDAWNIILACIPETKPWMLPFWITPSRGYSDPSLPGDAPTMVLQMAFFKRWHEAYGAFPVVVGSDRWSLIVKRPPETFAAAEALAWEHVAFCPEVFDEWGLRPYTVRALAEHLLQAKVWHFWWD